MSYYLTAQQKALMTPGTCLRCGKVVEYPRERNSAGRCSDCHNLEYLEGRAQRKASLAAMSRCAYCNRRGSWRIGSDRNPNSFLLCGAHKKLASAKIAGSTGFLGLCWTPSPEDVKAVLDNAINGVKS